MKSSTAFDRSTTFTTGSQGSVLKFHFLLSTDDRDQEDTDLEEFVAAEKQLIQD